jgi:phosphopantetheine adenylyltransferase
MKQVIFTTGRFNPPTRGHEKLLRKARSLARTTRADCHFYVTRTHDGKKNPLTVDQKLEFLGSFFPNTNFRSCINAFTACRELANEGYERAVLVVGADRASDLISGLRKYINHEDPSKSIGLQEIDTYVVERQEDDYSASEARKLALDGDLEGFTKLVPSADTRVINHLYHTVRQGLGVKDAI